MGFGSLFAVTVACSEDEGTPPTGDAGEAGAPEVPGGGQGGSAEIGGLGGAGGDGGVYESSSGTGPAYPPAPVVTGVDCNDDEVTLDADWVRHCVLLASCAPLGLQVSDCVANTDALAYQMTARHPDAPWPLDGRMLSCANIATSCEEVFQCTGLRRATSECAEDQAARCDGDLAITCQNGEERVIDCYRVTNAHDACEVVGTGANARAECLVRAECVPSRPRCDGDVLYSCEEGGPGYGVDCAQFSLSCVEIGETAACGLPLPTLGCDEPGVARCDGTELSFCAADGVEFTRDCSRALACVTGSGDMPTDDPWMDCALPGCDVRFEAFDACDGHDLMLDLGKQPASTNGVRLHCPDYGFETCTDGRCSNDAPGSMGGAGGI